MDTLHLSCRCSLFGCLTVHVFLFVLQLGLSAVSLAAGQGHNQLVELLVNKYGASYDIPSLVRNNTNYYFLYLDNIVNVTFRVHSPINVFPGICISNFYFLLLLCQYLLIEKNVSKRQAFSHAKVIVKTIHFRGIISSESDQEDANNILFLEQDMEEDNFIAFLKNNDLRLKLTSLFF